MLIIQTKTTYKNSLGLTDWLTNAAKIFSISINKQLDTFGGSGTNDCRNCLAFPKQTAHCTSMLSTFVGLLDFCLSPNFSGSLRKENMAW